jgi:hypothetical protein
VNLSQNVSARQANKIKKGFWKDASGAVEGEKAKRPGFSPASLTENLSILFFTQQSGAAEHYAILRTRNPHFALSTLTILHYSRNPESHQNW